jgi:PAS domain S-box-containing protein
MSVGPAGSSRSSPESARDPDAEAPVRVAGEQELRDHARQQAALAALAEIAMNAEEVGPLLAAACGTTQDVLGVDAAAFVELEGEELVVRASSGLDRSELAAPRAASAELRARIVAAAPDAEPALAPLLGFAAGAEVVLPGREKPVALLGCYARQPRTFSAGELRFLDTAASILASARARRRAELELLDREREGRAVFDGALDAMVIFDQDGRIRDANPATSRLTGAPRTALLERGIDDLAPGTQARFRAGAIGEAEVRGEGDRVRIVELTGVRQILPDRHLVVLRDVTERKHLDARLALADRMISVGTLAAGVAHELNNPLAYVSANLAFLAEQVSRLAELVASRGANLDVLADLGDLPAQLQDAVRDARTGCERMRVIVRDLKTFSRADEERGGTVDLGEMLASCVNMAWNEIRPRARLEKDLAPVPPVRGNEARLGQVFLNLLVNAAQAIPEGHPESNAIRLAARRGTDGRVVVEVSDSGTGIRPEHLSRIFDPFFTTKPPGVGTGLGLAICHSIVSALGGEIAVASTSPAGTTIRVSLPVAGDARTARTGAGTGAPAVRRTRGRLLVVDDEPLVGSVLARALGKEHEVSVVRSARAGLEKLEAEPGFDLIITDLLMPEMTGMDFYREISRRDPALARRVVFLTGGAFTAEARAFLEQERVTCLEKPFEVRTIRELLARRLAGAEP